MAEQQQGPDDLKPKNGLAAALENFNKLPPNAKLGVVGLFVFFFIVFLMRSGSDTQAPPVEQPASVKAAQTVDNKKDADSDSFSPVGPDRESLRRGFVTEQSLALERMRQELSQQSQKQNQEFEKRTQDMIRLQQQLEETMRTLNQQMQLMEKSNQHQREEVARLAEEARRQGLRPVGAGDESVQRRPRQKINQTPLGSASGPNVGPNQALLQGVLKTTTGTTTVPDKDKDGKADDEERLPFIPPLGFIKGTLLNGVDALASSGIATPALVRLKGVYKTAMNSTVTLNGCFMLVEFEGDISTERAKGKPSRMTCVYPDRGAVTYDVTGYVVDAEDGIEGVPGLFFEGDTGRIALAMAAEFASGIAGVVAQNQSTNVVDSNGTNQNFLTGSEARASIAGGASNALTRLTDYLLERADRVAPFIRLDAMREVHVVLLSGTELRPEGSAWSLLFSPKDGKLL